MLSRARPGSACREPVRAVAAHPEREVVARVEEPKRRPWADTPRAGRALRAAAAPLVAYAAIATFATATGCLPVRKKSSVAVPAAHREPGERPLDLLPPLQLSKDDDAIVRVVGEVTCTGTLIAEDLVLTAHHCVAARDARGRILHEDVAPADLAIELGGDHLPWGEVRVRAIVSPDCGWASGEGDLAILVLTRKLIGLTPFAVRLDGEPERGEGIRPVGFGRCALSSDGIQRTTREGGVIGTVRPRQFVAPASICPGDSGGPAISTVGGDVIGVISASVMDGDATTMGPSVFTRVDRFRPLFAAAREIAAGASPSELPPYRACAW